MAAVRPHPPRRGTGREGGFALLVVLWSLTLIALVVAQLTAAGRSETQIAANLRANAVLQAAADGAVHEAMLRLLQGGWAPDGRLHELRAGGAVVAVRVDDQSRLVNPNTASVEMIQPLLRSAGMDGSKAAALARAIVDWRSTGPQSLSGGLKLAQYQAASLPYGPPDRPFDSLNELGLVAGMTPALLARIRPYLSLYQEADAMELFEPASAGEPAGSADGWQFGASGRVMTVTVTAAAAGAKGGRSSRQATVRLMAEPGLNQAPYQVLTWAKPAE